MLKMQYVDYDKKGNPLHLFVVNNTNIVARNEKEAQEIYNNR